MISQLITESFRRGSFPFLVLLTASMLLVGNKSEAGGQDSNQQSQRLVEKIALKNEPLEMKEIKTKKHVINSGQAFSSGDEWVEGITFKFKNRSRKAVKRVELELEFPEIKMDKAALVLNIHYGQVPDLPEPDSTEMPVVQPDDTFDMSLDRSTYAGLKKRVFASLPRASVTHLRVRLSTVIFADGTAWHNGFLHKRDPNNPRKWIIDDARDPTEKPGFRLRHHANYKNKPPVGGLIVLAQQQCNVTYYGFEYVSCGTAGTGEDCDGPSVACGSVIQDAYQSNAPHPNAIGSENDYYTLCFKNDCLSVGVQFCGEPSAFVI